MKTVRLAALALALLFVARALAGETELAQALIAAEAAGRPVVVVAHDAGRYWPAHQFVKRPGTIEVRISPPIETTGRKIKEINDLAMAWLSEQMLELENLDV